MNSWLEEEVLPLVLDIKKENLLYVQKEIFGNDNFKSIVPIRSAKDNQLMKDFEEILKRSFYLRPSNWIQLSYLINFSNEYFHKNDLKNILQEEIELINSKEWIRELSSDNVQYFLNEKIDISDQFFNSLLRYYFLNDEILKNDQTIILIILSALFGSSNIFHYFLCPTQILQIKSEIENHLIRSSIIGGNHKIILTLHKLGFLFDKYFETAVKFHRNDVLIWILNHYDFNSNINVIFEIAEREMNFELINELNDLKIKSQNDAPQNAVQEELSQSGYHIIENENSVSSTDKQLKRRGFKPRNL